MNEIKHIHLGRQSFTISVEAYKELHDYLGEIKAQVGKASGDVVDEVELRMAELLTERGVTDEKVVLAEDVKYLKEQLGEPHDFKDEDEEQAETTDKTEDGAPKRLFRDNDRAMFAGVAAGLSAFFGVDVTIIRLIFILLTFFGGSGIVIYIVLWLIVPEARTSSERLQMRGKAVTVDSLKEVIDRANISGAAERVGKVSQQIGVGIGRQLSKIIETCAKILLGITGSVIMLAAGALFVGASIASAYMLIHGGKMADQVVFPVGAEAVAGVLCAMVVLYALALLLMVAGLSMARRKTVVRGWVVAATIGVFLIAGGLGTAFGFDIAPQIRDKYRALHHTQTTAVQPFSKLNVIGKDVKFDFVPDDKYSVEVAYFGKTNKVSDITQKVDDDTLTVDTTKYTNEGEKCVTFCLYSGDWLTVKIHAPTLQVANVRGQNVSLGFSSDFHADKLAVAVSERAIVSLDNLQIAKISVDATGQVRTRHAALEGITNGNQFNTIGITESNINIDSAREVNVTTQDNGTCMPSQSTVFLQKVPQTLTVNGAKIEPPTRNTLERLWSANGPNVYNCVVVDGDEDHEF